MTFPTIAFVIAGFVFAAPFDSLTLAQDTPIDSLTLAQGGPADQPIR